MAPKKENPPEAHWSGVGVTRDHQQEAYSGVTMMREVIAPISEVGKHGERFGKVSQVQGPLGQNITIVDHGTDYRPSAADYVVGDENPYGVWDVSRPVTLFGTRSEIREWLHKHREFAVKNGNSQLSQRERTDIALGASVSSNVAVVVEPAEFFEGDDRYEVIDTASLVYDMLGRTAGLVLMDAVPGIIEGIEHAQTAEHAKDVGKAAQDTPKTVSNPRTSSGQATRLEAARDMVGLAGEFVGHAAEANELVGNPIHRPHKIMVPVFKVTFAPGAWRPESKVGAYHVLTATDGREIPLHDAFLPVMKSIEACEQKIQDERAQSLTHRVTDPVRQTVGQASSSVRKAVEAKLTSAKQAVVARASSVGSAVHRMAARREQEKLKGKTINP